MLTPTTSPIYVTKTFLPPLEEYNERLQEIWRNNWLTNNGPFVRELETKLGRRFGSGGLLFVSNGTIALQLALKSLDVKGSVITTPFSYVATTNALLWDNIDPLFVDVDRDQFTINPDLIEAALRHDTTAILATHVYGYPCRHERLQAIADRHGLALIYDAAHAFDVSLDGQSILNWGDISTLSFHATKVFHTVEGGGIVSDDPEIRYRLDRLRSFGHIGRDYLQLGINGKNSEFHAAMGLSNLQLLETNRTKRKRISELYRELLADLPLRCLSPEKIPGLYYNYAYFPVICHDVAMREDLILALNRENVFPRRYFEPSLNQLSFLPAELQVSCPISERAANTVFCLPLYPDLPEADVRRISHIIRKTLNEWW